MDGEISRDELVAVFGEDNAAYYMENVDNYGDQSGTVDLTEWILHFSHNERGRRRKITLEMIPSDMILILLNIFI